MSSLKTLMFRNSLVESHHVIKCYVGSLNGDTIFSTENSADLIYPRSSIKIFQGIPFSNSKAIDFYKLNKKQIALSCSSHNAESFHIKELDSWLKKTNLTSSHLKCGIHNPLDKKSSEKLFLCGKKPYQIHNNCAGKHLAMLSSCLMNKLPIKNYLDFDHPHQKSIRDVFSIFTENNIPKKNYGIDGCSAPQYAFKIEDLAQGLCNLLKSYNGKFDYAENVKLIINSVIMNPLFIGGSKNLDSNLMKISNKKIFCKGGAEGVFLFIHLKKGIFGVLKVIDGNERVLPSAVCALFEKLQVIGKEELKKLKEWSSLELHNHAKIKIGAIKTIIK